MNQTRKLLYFFTCILCISCNKPESHVLHFSKSYEVQGDTIPTLIENINDLVVTKNHLVVSQFGSNHLLKVLDTASFQQLGEFATQGSGENEFPTMLVIDHYERIGVDDCLWVHDINKGEVVNINLTESIKNNTTVIEDKIMTRAESKFYTVFVIDSSRVIGRSTNSTPQMNRLQIYDPLKDEITKTIPLFPKIKRSRNDLDYVLNKYNMLYVSNIGLKSDKTRIASAMCSFDRIDIFRTDGELENSVFDGEEIPDYNLEYLIDRSSDKLNMYYGKVCTSNNFIYSLYYGQPFSEYGKKPIPTQVRIFDWSGEPVCKIEVKDYLYTIAINEESGLMFGVDFFNKQILKYNIKHILNEL